MSMRFKLTGFIVAAMVGCTGATWAQSGGYPNKAIKMVVSFPPGGGTDGAGRLFAERFAAALGQPVVVENRAGASGTIGAHSVVRAEADGYTVLFSGETELTIAPITMKGLAYDPRVDFQPITMIGEVPFILVANPKFPPNTVAELIAYAKANPTSVSYSSFGNNTSNHLVTERFKAAAGIKVTHIPYKGSAPSVTDLVGGHVQFTFDTPASTFQLVNTQRLKLIAVGSPQRLPTAPNTPTLSEAGLPGFVASTYWGLLAPAKTPKAIVDVLSTAAIKALASVDLKNAYQSRDILPSRASTPEAFGQFIVAELAKWRALVSAGSIVPE